MSVTEKNAVPLSLPASSPALPRLALLSLARLIADRVFARRSTIQRRPKKNIYVFSNFFEIVPICLVCL